MNLLLEDKIFLYLDYLLDFLSTLLFTPPFDVITYIMIIFLFVILFFGFIKFLASLGNR